MPTPTLGGHTAVPAYALDASFVDPLHGWLLGLKIQDTQAYYVLATTADGGKTWQPSSLAPVPYQVEWWNQAGIFFANADNGWFYYPGVVFSTRNAGQTWAQDRIDGRIVMIDRAPNGMTWAFEGRDAAGVLWKLNEPTYTQWEELTAAFPTDMRQAAELTLLDESHWWLIYWATDERGHIEAYLLFTNNQGQTWESLPSPCNGYGTQGGTLVAIDTLQYWLSCSAVLTSTEGRKAVFTSSDGGHTWVLKGKAVLSAEDTLSTFGIVSSFGALSNDFAYMSLDKTAQVLITYDSGATWQYSSIPCAEDHIRAKFLDEQYGWVWGGSCFSRTLDGGLTWECGLLPDSRPCSQQ